MSLDIGTLVAKVKVDDSDFDQKTSQWSTKGAAVGSAFGNVAADAISQATSMLTTFVGEAGVASDATDKFAKTLEFAGLDSSTIDAYLASTQAYADQTVYSLGDIQSITAQLASNGIEGPDKLATSLGNLNAIAGGNAETFGRVGSVLTQTAGQGKLTTENWNQLAEAIPGASGVLMTALQDAGAYTGNFRDAMSEGQITAEEFNAAIMKVGTDPIAVEAAKSVETFEGAQGNLAAAIQSQLVIALDALKPAFTGIQNGLAWFISNSGLLVPALAALGTVLLVVLGPAIWAAVAATWAWTAALLANPVTWIVLAIALLVGAIVWLIMNWDTAVAFISEIWGGFLGWMTGVIEGFVGWWTPIWEGIASFFTSVWEGIVAVWTTVWTAIVDFFTPIVEFIATIIRVYVEIWMNVFMVFAAVLIQIWIWISEGVTAAWNAIVAFITPVVEGIARFIIDVLNNLAAGWNAIWSAISGFFSGIWQGMVAFFTPIINQILSFIVSTVNTIQGIWNSVWSAISSFFAGIWNGMIGAVQGPVNTILGIVGGIQGTVMGFFGGIGDWLVSAGKSLIQGFIDGISGMIGAVGDAVGGVLNWAKGFFPNSPAKRGPFSGSGWTSVSSSGAAIMEAFAEGMHGADPFADESLSLMGVPSSSRSSWSFGPPVVESGAKHVHLTMPAGATTEEQIFEALGSPRVED